MQSHLFKGVRDFRIWTSFGTIFYVSLLSNMLFVCCCQFGTVNLSSCVCSSISIGLRDTWQVELTHTCAHTTKSLTQSLSSVLTGVILYNWVGFCSSREDIMPQAWDCLATLIFPRWPSVSQSFTSPDVFLMMMPVSLANSHAILSPLVGGFWFY